MAFKIDWLYVTFDPKPNPSFSLRPVSTTYDGSLNCSFPLILRRPSRIVKGNLFLSHDTIWSELLMTINIIDPSQTAWMVSTLWGLFLITWRLPTLVRKTIAGSEEDRPFESEENIHALSDTLGFQDGW